MKLTKPQLTLPTFFNKTVLLICAAVLFIVAITLTGMAFDTRQNRVEAAEQALEVQRQKDRDVRLAELTEANEQLKARVQYETSKSASVCDWVRSVAADKTKKLSVPPLCVKS